MTTKEIGRVTGVRLGVEDHGILTLDVAFDFGGSGQSFGGIALDTWDPVKRRRVGTAAGNDYILRVLGVFGVGELAAIRGRVMYVIRDGERGPIVGLESPPFDGSRRFMVDEWRAEWIRKGDSNG